MSRLPVPGSDVNVWGNVLNDFLSQSLNSDGSLKSSALGAAGAEIASNKGAANGYAPLDSSSKVPSANLPTIAPGGSAGGDLSGTYPNPTVAKVNGVAVSGTPASGKIIRATSATAATWQTRSNPWQFDVVADYGAKGDGSTDDTSAFQSAVNAAVTYAQANSGYAEVIVPPAAAYYAINGSLQTGASTKGNSQITLPIVAPTANKVTLVIKGVENGSGILHWQQTTRQINGATLVSNGVFANSTAQGNNIDTFGEPCVIGGPNQPNGYGTSALLFSNMLVVLKGISILTTHSASGLSYSGVDFSGVAEANIFDCHFATTGTVASGQYNTPAAFSGGFSKGILMPANGNNDNNVIRNLSIGGGFAEGILATEHTIIESARLLYCWSAITVVGGYYSSVGASHAVIADQLSVEGCTNLLRIRGVGQSGIGPFIDFAQLDTESGTPAFVDDGSNGIKFALGTIKLVGLFTVANITIGTTGLKLLNGQQTPGYVAAPSYTLGAAFINPWWRDATIHISGGTVTGVKIGATNGGSVAPTMQTTGLTSGTFRLPSGGWFEIDGTVKPTMTVILD